MVGLHGGANEEAGEGYNRETEAAGEVLVREGLRQILLVLGTGDVEMTLT